MTETPQVNADVSVQSEHLRSTVEPPLLTQTGRARSDTERSVADRSFSEVVSVSEKRRVKRCKGMIYGLKHISTSVDTLLLLDSNGRSITSEDIDGAGTKVCLRQIGGLCVSATTNALKECKVKYPKIKTLAYGLGTNDHLHASEHPGERTEYIKELNEASKKVFPNATIHFILPFSAIKGLSVQYVQSLSASIRAAGVGWKVHKSPSMRGHLTSPQMLHVTPAGRVIFTLWLRKIFTPDRPTVTPTVTDTVTSAQVSDVHYSGPPSVRNRKDSQHLSYAAVAARDGGSEPGTVDPRRLPHPVLQEASENKYSSLDLLLKDRLYELVMGSHSSLRQSTNRHRWADY